MKHLDAEYDDFCKNLFLRCFFLNSRSKYNLHVIVNLLMCMFKPVSNKNPVVS